ncbi:Endothiapepsin [Tolypocladium ophioglossoides CBS 100239]|uniref:Endothiapepsin n=1 Tax=Tolypocladium ophioglossoides (strain CBS 100239) TaxID=1163406 RepID=A0A0L0MZU1_TOLOC|nr:Endothiapepsin [Tolypocladium ophioglossoides CBS 100239]
MKATLAAFAFASLAKGAVPAPRAEASESPNGGKTFTLTQIQNERFLGHDVPMSFIKAHMKYAQALPPQLSRAVELNPDLNSKFLALTQQQDGGSHKGTVEARPAPMFDSEYVVPVQIGTPGQSVPLNLDTGSSDLWTFSTETYKPLVNRQALYRPGNSSTSELLKGQSWQVKYGDGTGASGIVYKDRVQIGATYVNRQAVQAAVQVSYGISSDSFSSGTLGLASSAANTVRPTKQLAYIDNVKDDLALPLFTANLHRRRPGNYNFGYIDSSEHTGPIQYAELNRSSPFWKISVSGYQVGDNNYEQYLWSGIVDTGTSLLLVPDNIVKSYYDQLTGSGIDKKVGMMVYPCSTNPPDFRFGIDSYRGLVPGEYINYGQVNQTHCLGGIQTSWGIGFAVLGDVLLKAQFVVFDYGSAQVGFANKNLK